MPARAESLAITERYRSGMVRLRQQGQREAKRIWNQVSPDDLDGTFNVGLLELTVNTLQREAARLSSAYLSTFIASELGEPERPPAVSVWDKAFNGGNLREALRSPVIKAKVAIGEGEDPKRATNNSRAILVSDVGLFIDTAARESLRQGMEMDDRIVGYQRALKGTCGACAGDTTYEAFSENAPVAPLNVHPNCQCVAEPVVQPKSPEESMRGREFSGRAVGQWTEEDVLAAEQYFGREVSFDLNAYLRHGTIPRGADSEDFALWTEWMDDLLEHAGPVGRQWTQAGFRMTKDPVRVYRGIPGLAREAKIPNIRGRTFTDKAFGSTTSDSGYAEKWLLMAERKEGMIWELDIDPRVKGLWGANPSESELLLERGVRYIIRDVKTTGKNQWRIKADVLPPK